MGNQEEYMDEIYKMLSDTEGRKLIDIINERMKEFDISAYQMGKMLSISKSTFERLIKKIESGDVEKVDFYTILKIAEFLNISISEISQVYVSSLKPSFISELEVSTKANLLYRYFDLKGLKSVGFIDDMYDVKAIENKILKFFGIGSLQEYKTEIGAVLFSRTKKTSHDKMREFWVRAAYYQFEKINNPNEYDRDKLLAILPKIRPYTRHEEKGLLTVLQALYNIGITVILQKYLSKTQVRGATFVINNNKPCIVITDFNDSYATIWFALLHELYHVAYDFEELKVWKYHLTGEADLELFKDEDLADYFSMEMLFPKEKLNYIKHMIKMPAIVMEYAEQNKVHPSIIYSFYCYDENKKGRNYYPLYRQYFGKPDKALKSIQTNPWNKETIFEEIKKVKSALETIV